MSLKGKTLFITGASRGIGRAIALRAARDGVAAKTETAHPKLEGTIHRRRRQSNRAAARPCSWLSTCATRPRSRALLPRP